MNTLACPGRPLAIVSACFALTLAAGCGGSATPSKPQGSSVPRVPPPPPRAAALIEPEPERPAPAIEQPRYPVGPYLRWQVADNPPITEKGYLKLIVNTGGDAVLELANYDVPAHEQYPSLYLRALVPAKSIDELVDRKLPAQLFVEVEKDGNILHSLPAQPAEIVVSEIANKNVRGTFAGNLQDVDSGGIGTITGRFQAVMP